MAEELRELRNNVQIVGLLKTKSLEEKTTKSGKLAIMGYLIIEVKDGENIQNIRVSVYAGKFKKDGTISKLYTSDKKVMDEFKDIDKFGRENADYISVSGNLSGNDFVNAQGNLVSTTQVRGVFMSREEDREANKPHAWATVESVINGMTDVEDADGPTGDKSVEAYTVGYGGTVIELQNVIIKSDIAQQFETMYFPGTMGLITYKINNYAQVKVEEPTEATQHGFGSTDMVEESVVQNYVTNLEIIGGEQPVDNGTEFTAEQIDEIVAQRKQQIATASAPKTQAPTTGFGGNDVQLPPNAKPSGQPKAETANPWATKDGGSTGEDDFDAF